MKNKFRRLKDSLTASQLSWGMLLHILAYVILFLALSAMIAWVLVQTRVVIMQIAIHLQWSAGLLMVMDRCLTIPLALIAIGTIVLLEQYLRKSIAQQRLWLLAARVFLVVLGIYALEYFLEYLLHT